MMKNDSPSLSIKKYEPEWIQLTEPKQWSRLLYTNPVCFLCTTTNATTTKTILIDNDDDGSSNNSITSKEEHQKEVDVKCIATTASIIIDDNDDNNNKTNHDTRTIKTIRGDSKQSQEQQQYLDDNDNCVENTELTVTTTNNTNRSNVMVLSWLTPANNDGCFVFSINKRRYSANFFLQQRQKHQYKNFVLCVPVAGMEDLVCAVGSTSGGSNKFEKSYQHQQEANKNTNIENKNNNIKNNKIKQVSNNTNSSSKFTETTINTLSRRQKKKHGYPNGIPGLRRIPVGGDCGKYNNNNKTIMNTTPDNKLNNNKKNNSSESASLFAIDGCVAQLICSPYNILLDVVDTDHILVSARITDAYVMSNYWDNNKNIFHPISKSSSSSTHGRMNIEKSGDDYDGEPLPSLPPPYLTFFGSQKFGYVVT